MFWVLLLVWYNNNMETKILNLNILKNGIPAELYLYLGLQSKKNKIIVYINTDEKSQKIVIQTIKNLFEFFNNKNIIIVFSPIGKAVPVNIVSKLGLYFSNNITDDLLSKNKNVNSFITEFEKLFGEVPFYTKTNMNLEKYCFINDVILKLNDDIISH